MRGTVIALLVFGFIHSLSGPTDAQTKDLRAEYGTRSLTAARHLDEGIKLAEAGNVEQALTVLAKAIRADRNLLLAYYWKALAQTDLGQVEEALETYETLIEMGEKGPVNSVTVDACVNLALTYVKIDEPDSAAKWFSKAILLDPSDSMGLHWKAYRNMALTRHHKQDNFSAAMGALNAFQANPEKVDLNMVVDFLDRVESRDEVAKLLFFDDEVPEVEKRAASSQLTELPFGSEIQHPVWQLFSDPSGQRVVVICPDVNVLYLIDTQDGNSVKELSVPGPVTAGCVVSGKLYIATASPSMIKELDWTGLAVKEWKIPKPTATIAMLPSKGVGFFPLNNMLAKLDLDSGNVEETDYYSNVVASDPQERFCFSFVKPESRSSVGHVVVNGRPMFFQRRTQDWSQTTLFKFAVEKKSLMLASVRANAASNGRRLEVSADGQWVGVAGGGGWRSASQSGGYGVAVFPTASLPEVQGFYDCQAYPAGFAVNHITQQVAVIREQDISVHHLSGGGKTQVLTGKFGGASAWSPDGRKLFVAGEKGLLVYGAPLTDSESTFATKWLSEQPKESASTPGRQSTPEGPSSPASEGDAKPVPFFANFKLHKTKSYASKALDMAIKFGRTDRPREWLQYEPYQQDAQLAKVFQDTVNKKDRGDAGIRIFKLKKAKSQQEHPGLDFLLGINYYFSGQNETAIPLFVECIKTDAGRTNLTLESLRGLSHALKDDPHAAAYCCACALLLDKANPSIVREAGPLFAAVGLSRAAQPILSSRSESAPITSTIGGKLPVLPKRAATRVHSADVIFRGASPSVVLIKSPDGTGTGVCVGRRGIVLTNAHVVGEHGRLDVLCFAINGNQTKRLPATTAQRLYYSDEQDIAVISLDRPPSTLVPLTVAATAPATGTTVYAIGNPGLDRGAVLEQTISEGIISSNSRQIDGLSFLQHTAAVNGGNSGGPLLNAHGQIVGIVTLKARLENVSFAIPALRVRAIFPAK